MLIKIFFEFDRLFLRFKQEGGLYSEGGGGITGCIFLFSGRWAKNGGLFVGVGL